MEIDNDRDLTETETPYQCINDVLEARRPEQYFNEHKQTTNIPLTTTKTRKTTFENKLRRLWQNPFTSAKDTTNP